MAKLSFNFLPLLLCVLLQRFSPAHCLLRSPFPAVYQYDLGDGYHLNSFFQYSKAPRGFTRVFADKTGTKFSVKTNTNPIDLASILYRTHRGKGVLFHFQEGSLKKIEPLHQLLQAIDRPYNVYKLPIAPGPYSIGTVDHVRFLGNYSWRAKIAFGFSPERESTVKNTDGYTQAQIDELAKLTKPYCAQRDSRFYIAFNAYHVGAAEKNVAIDFYKKFHRCRLLLYTMPKQPLVNVRRVKELLLDHVNMDRMLVLVSGHSLAYRLFSLDCVAWGYVQGHMAPRNQQLGEYGLISILESGAKTIHLRTFEVTQRHKLNLTFAFRHVTEKDLARNNFDADVLQYLAQVVDRSRIVLLYPGEYKNLVAIMNEFETLALPFIEARVLRGPNAQQVTVAENKAFWAAMAATTAPQKRRYKVVFSFSEAFGSKYHSEHIKELVTLLKVHEAAMREVRFGLMLEIGFMNLDVDFKELLSYSKFQYVFLKVDVGNFDEKALEMMTQWIKLFQDKIVLLLVGAADETVNQLYRHFARVEPVDTSLEGLATDAPTEVTEVTVTGETVATTATVTVPEEVDLPIPAGPPVIIERTTMAPEPPLVNNTEVQVHSGAAVVQRSYGVIGGLVVMALGTGVGLLAVV